MQDRTGNERNVGEEGLENEHAMEAEADLEARMASLAERVVELEGELSAAECTLRSRDRSAELEDAVRGSGAIERDAVRALIERTLANEAGMSVAEALADVRDRKPVLFRARAASASVMGEPARKRGGGELDAVRHAAAEGDRASLLRYLRLRREQG